MTAPEIPEDVAREIVLEWCSNWMRYGVTDIERVDLANLIASALRARDERAAKIAETFPPVILQMWDRPGGPPGNGQRASNVADIAAAIRARS